MPNPNPKITVKFTQVGEKPLAKKIIGVRLPIELDEAVRNLPDDLRSEWLRKAIAEYARKDGLIAG